MAQRLVIVVDDETLIAHRIEEALLAAGFSVSSARSAEQALEIVAGLNEAAALITDIQLPDMSG